MADQGGVIGVYFCPHFLRKDQPATVDDVVEHIMYLVNVGGIQCVGLGSDFDGIDQTPLGLEHYGKTMDLADSLMDRGLSADHVEKIMGGNLKRICCIVLD